MPCSHSVKRRFSSLISALSHPLPQTPFQSFSIMPEWVIGDCSSCLLSSLGSKLGFSEVFVLQPFAARLPAAQLVWLNVCLGDVWRALLTRLHALHIFLHQREVTRAACSSSYLPKAISQDAVTLGGNMSIGSNHMSQGCSCDGAISPTTSTAKVAVNSFRMTNASACLLTQEWS